MADVNCEMVVDSQSGVLPQSLEASWKRDLSKLREDFTQSYDDILGTIRQTVREEITSALSHRPSEIVFQEKDRVSEAEKEGLNNEIQSLKEQVDRQKQAVRDRDAKNKRLKQVIIENSQKDTPPVDEEVVKLFNDLKNDIMKTVKKHFRKPLPLKYSNTPGSWKEYNSLSAENKELWVRSFIADELYTIFFLKKRKIYGLDPAREDAMQNFEALLEGSGKVSEADIVDWRIRTVSLVQKLDISPSPHSSGSEAYKTVEFLRPIVSSYGGEADAVNAMMAIFYRALRIAMLFRSNTVSYSWLQKKSLSQIRDTDFEIIGSASPKFPVEQCKLWKIIFGGVVKNHDSEEDSVNLTKSELLVN